jgi:hypothetical protein
MRNAASPRFNRFLLEVTRWLRTAVSTLDTAEGLSLGQYVERHGYSQRFRSHPLIPLTSDETMTYSCAVGERQLPAFSAACDRLLVSGPRMRAGDPDPGPSLGPLPSLP